jgi:hypothetical protein
VPSAILPSELPSSDAATDPIAEVLSGEAGPEGVDAVEGETAEEPAPEPARRRYRRKREAPDAWKKNYPIFGGR